jgi:HlyD family secretion protein
MRSYSIILGWIQGRSGASAGRTEMRRYSIILGALAIALTGCGNKTSAKQDAGGGDPTAKPIVQVSLAVVKRENLRSTVPVTGTLAPLPDHEANAAPLAPGRIRQILVKTGDTVSKGQVIAILDSGALTGQLQQAEATVSADAATLQQALLNLSAAQSSQQAAVAQARTNLRAQQVALERLQAGSRPQEIAQAQSAVTAAEASLTNAEQGLARAQTLYSEGLLARKDLESAQTQEKTALAGLTSAQESLSLVKQGNRPQDIEAGQIAVRQAQEQLTAAQAQTIQVQSKAQDVTIAKKQWEAALGALKAISSQMKAQTIRAPLSGVVVKCTLNTGESVDVTGTVATIVNLHQLQVLLNIPVNQVPLVHPGQIMQFSTDLLPGRIYLGKIILLNRAVDPVTDTVQAVARVDNPDQSLRDDGFVRGAIITAVHSDSLVVPAGALVKKDGKFYVFFVGSDNIAHMREVKPGLQEGQDQEILSGVKAGEQVVTTGAYELADGIQVKAAQ